MGRTKIEWASDVWNPIVGCSVVSPGCTNCYAMRMAGRLEKMASDPNSSDAFRRNGKSPYDGLTQPSKAGAVWTSKVALASDRTLLAPLGWKRPRRIFVNSMGDLFHEAVPDEWIDRVFAVMALAPQHTFVVLTKRAKRMREYLTALTVDRMELAMDDLSLTESQLHEIVKVATTTVLPNVVLGVSVERQQEADERIPDLLATPAAKRIVSAEPLLEEIDFDRWLDPTGIACADICPDSRYLKASEISYVTSKKNEAIPLCPHCGALAQATGYDDGLDGVILGGESGPGARPMHPDWARSIRDQCAAAGTPFFFKQWGEFLPAVDRDAEDPDWRLDYSYKYADGGKNRWLNLAGGCGFHGERFHVMRRVGKRRAGRLLDDVEHNEMPGIFT